MNPSWISLSGGIMLTESCSVRWSSNIRSSFCERGGRSGQVCAKIDATGFLLHSLTGFRKTWVASKPAILEEIGAFVFFMFFVQLSRCNIVFGADDNILKLICMRWFRTGTGKLSHYNFTQMSSKDNGTSTSLSVVCSDAFFSLLSWHMYFINITWQLCETESRIIGYTPRISIDHRFW